MSSKNWDPQLEGGLPDCRLKLGRQKKTVFLGRMLMERVFCANCAADGGLITADWAEHVFYLCDECAPKHGVPGTLEIPESVVKG